MSTADWHPASRNVPELFEDYARLQGECPVPFSTDFGGFWTLLGYDDLRTAATDHAVYRNGRPFLMDTGSERFVPESLNPPEHTAYRRLLNPHFTSARMAAFESTVRALAGEHLDGYVAAGGGDFVTEVSYAMPTRVLCAFLNLPDDLWRTIKGMTKERTDASMDGSRVESTTGRFVGAIRELVESRRRSPLSTDSDLISALLAEQIDGRPLDDDEVTEIAYQVMIAGADTTSVTLGAMAFLLATHPEQQAKLRADRTLVPDAVEEVLRLHPALHYMGRTLAQPVTLHGRTMPAGAAVALNFAAANRDRTVFADPDAFDVTRTPNRHVTFGHGIHKCVGAPLARLQLTVVLDEVLRRTSEFALAGEAERGSTYPAAFRTVPIRLTS